MKLLRGWTAGILVVGVALGAEPSPAPVPASDSKLVERVEVTLVETILRAHDRRGSPVTDLKPEEIEVTEGGDARRVGYFEPFLSKGHELSPGNTAEAAALYDAEGRPVVPEDSAAVLPPRPSRRIVLAFDVVNSKVRSRDAWKGAALDWARSSMRDGDRVALVSFRNVPDWVQRTTNDPAAVRRALESLDLQSRAPQRDRRAEITRLFREVSACAEVAESGGGHGTAAGGGADIAGTPRGSPRGASDEIDCALSIVEPYVAQWSTESVASIQALRTLVGQLGAVPGRKEVILFSDGIIPDPSGLATNTMLAVFGSERMDLSSVTSHLGLGREVTDEIAKLHEEARAGGVVFFTFDTRSGAERGYSDNIEIDRPINFKALGSNPWAESYEATTSTLTVLAEESGGDSFHGASGLSEKVAQAAESYFGTYALGFYRPESSKKPGKLKLKIKRSGVELEYGARVRPQPKQARPARLDVSIRPPEPTGAGDRQMLPVVLDVALAELPLRKAEGTYGCQLGIFVQAARPDGTVVTEAFQDATAEMELRPKERDPSTSYRALVKLDLPPGPYRLRARISDDRQVMIAERLIDLTLGIGVVRGGFGTPAADPPADSRR